MVQPSQVPDDYSPDKYHGKQKNGLPAMASAAKSSLPTKLLQIIKAYYFVSLGLGMVCCMMMTGTQPLSGPGVSATEMSLFLSSIREGFPCNIICFLCCVFLAEKIK